MSVELNQCPAAVQETATGDICAILVSEFSLYARFKFPVAAKRFHYGSRRIHMGRGMKTWPGCLFTHNVINDTIRNRLILLVSLNHFNLSPQNSISILCSEEHFWICMVKLKFSFPEHHKSLIKTSASACSSECRITVAETFCMGIFWPKCTPPNPATLSWQSETRGS